MISIYGVASKMFPFLSGFSGPGLDLVFTLFSVCEKSLVIYKAIWHGHILLQHLYNATTVPVESYSNCIFLKYLPCHLIRKKERNTQ